MTFIGTPATNKTIEAVLATPAALAVVPDVTKQLERALAATDPPVPVPAKTGGAA